MKYDSYPSTRVTEVRMVLLLAESSRVCASVLRQHALECEWKPGWRWHRGCSCAMWVNGPSCGFACMRHTCKICISMNVIRTSENWLIDDKMTVATLLHSQVGNM